MPKRKTKVASIDPTRDIERLRDYLASLSTESLCIYLEHLSTISDGILMVNTLGLQSPYREMAYAMGLAATTPEPSDPAPSDEECLAQLLEAVHDKYGERYKIFESDAGRDKVFVALGAFAKRFFAGRFLGVPQVIKRVRDYLIPFDATLSAVAGLSATEAQRVADAMGRRLQEDLDRLHKQHDFANSPLLLPAARAGKA